MFEMAILSAIFCICTVATVTIYQRRQDVLYGSYIETAGRYPAPQDDAIEAGAP